MIKIISQYALIEISDYWCLLIRFVCFTDTASCHWSITHREMLNMVQMWCLNKLPKLTTFSAIVCNHLLPLVHFQHGWKLLEMCDRFYSLPAVPILHFFTRVLLLAYKIANEWYQLCWFLKIFFHSKGCWVVTLWAIALKTRMYKIGIYHFLNFHDPNYQ